MFALKCCDCVLCQTVSAEAHIAQADSEADIRNWHLCGASDDQYAWLVCYHLIMLCPSSWHMSELFHVTAISSLGFAALPLSLGIVVFTVIVLPYAQAIPSLGFVVVSKLSCCFMQKPYQSGFCCDVSCITDPTHNACFQVNFWVKPTKCQNWQSI